MCLSKTLKTDMPSVAKMLQSMGRGRDTILAHITPEEAELLKAQGGSGTINPETGLLEFQEVPVTEAVTVSAAPEPVSITIPEMYYYQEPTRYEPPAVSAPVTPAPMPTANVAPAAAAVTPPAAAAAAPQAPKPGPGISGAPTREPAPEAPTTTLSQDVGGFLSNNKTLLSILGLGGLALAGRPGPSQGAQLQRQLSELAGPIQAAGNAALRTTLAGGLTPSNMQALEAARAQVASQQARGAIASDQAAQSISRIYSQLMQNQLSEAINLLNTSNVYLQNAYLQGYQANATNQASTQNFYSTLGQLAARMGGMGGTVVTLPAGATVA